MMQIIVFLLYNPFVIYRTYRVLIVITIIVQM